MQQEALCWPGHTNVRVVNFYYYSFPTCILSGEQCQKKLCRNPAIPGNKTTFFYFGLFLSFCH